MKFILTKVYRVYKPSNTFIKPHYGNAFIKSMLYLYISYHKIHLRNSILLLIQNFNSYDVCAYVYILIFQFGIHERQKVKRVVLSSSSLFFPIKRILGINYEFSSLLGQLGNSDIFLNHTNSFILFLFHHFNYLIY